MQTTKQTNLITMKTIHRSLKTMFFTVSSVVILFVAGCGVKTGDSDDAKTEFNSKMIEEVQYRVPPDMPIVIQKIAIARDESKTTDASIFGNFTAIAITTENLYEPVPPGTDLKRLAPGYLSDDELNSVKSNLATKLNDIYSSATSIPRTSVQHAAITEKANAGRMLLTRIRGFDSYSFATIGVAQGTEILVKGTVSATLSSAKKWTPDEIKITGMELHGMELNGRSLFVASKRKNSELIIGENMDGNTEIARRKEIVEDAINAVDEAEKEVADALEALRKLKAANAEPSTGKDEAPQGEVSSGNGPPPPEPPRQWYDESKINELIRTDAAAAMRQLFNARNFEPKNHKHHYWSALAYYEMGKGSPNGDNFANARSSMAKAVELYPAYKNDPRVKATPCAECKGMNFETCKKANCNEGKIQKTCTNCSRYSQMYRYLCTVCRGTRKTLVDCPDCKGAGKIKTNCNACDSTGKFFHQILGLQ